MIVPSAPIDDNAVPKVDDAISVGEDLGFQEAWWKFENIVWLIFGLILVADLLGMFGRGWFARAQAGTPETAMSIRYESVERASTPSMITVALAPEAVIQGKAHLFVSDSVLKELGAQRVVPQPESSVIGNGGVTYTFPVSALPATIQFELEPSFPGIRHWKMQVPGNAMIQARVIVVP